MIDLHSHILPGLDDGPSTLEESIEMCRMAAADGIRTIVAAPHFKPGRYGAEESVILERTAELKNALASQSILIRIIPASEVTITPELSEHLASRNWLFINKTGKYFIAEFGNDVVPPQWSFLFSSLLRSGRIPIITHPERCSRFADHPEELRDFVEKGGLVQITAMSLTGELGEEIQELAEAMLRDGLVHVIATDAHSATWRPPLLSRAVARAAAIVGRDRALAMVTEIPAAIIEGKSIAALPPAVPEEAPKRGSWIDKIIGRR